MSKQEEIVWAESLATAKPGEHVRYFEHTGREVGPVPVVKVGRTLITVKLYGREFKFRIESGIDAAFGPRSPGDPSRVVDKQTFEREQLSLKLYARLVSFGIRLDMPRATNKPTIKELLHVANYLSECHGLEPL